jgi:hypothetical protein
MAKFPNVYQSECPLQHSACPNFPGRPRLLDCSVTQDQEDGQDSSPETSSVLRPPPGGLHSTCRAKRADLPTRRGVQRRKDSLCSVRLSEGGNPQGLEP